MMQHCRLSANRIGSYMASGDVLAFLQSDWVALRAATLHNSMYGNVPGLFSPYRIGLDAPGYYS